MRKQHIAGMSSEVFCLWLLTWKYFLIHPFLIDVIVIFSGVLRPIHEVRFRNELDQLILMSVIFSTTKVLYNISSLGGLAISRCPENSLARVQGFSLMVTTHNSTALKENGMADDIFIFNSFWVKIFFVSGHQKQKRSIFMPTIFLSFSSSSSDMHQSHRLDGCQAMGINSFLIFAFWVFHFL